MQIKPTLRLKKLVHQGIFLWMIGCAILGSNCSKHSNLSPEQSWVRVYDHPDYNLVFYPTGIAELPDHGFLILSGNKYDTITSAWTIPYLLGVDNTGQTLWSFKVDAPYVSPVPNIISVGGNFYFFCMDQVTLGTHLLSINKTGGAPSLYKTFDDLTYPLSASQMSDGKVLLTSYERLTRSSVVTCFNSTYDIVWSKKYNVIEDVEDKVIYHLTQRKQIFPFFAGEIPPAQGNYYFVNSFYNYSFSLLFINASSGDMTGLVNGYQYTASASSLTQRKDTSYLLTRYNEGEYYINTSAKLSFTTIQNIDALGGINWAEIAPGSEVKTMLATINGKQTGVIAAATKTNQVLLLFFNPETGTVSASKYLGNTYPCKIASIIPTQEGGIAVLLQTQVAGRFARIQLYKIPPQDIAI